MARHLAPVSCRQTIAERVRRRSFGCVLPLGRHASTNGSKLIQCASDSIALSSFQEGQNARHHNRCKREQALVGHLPWGVPYWAASDGEETHVTASEESAAPLERRREESARTTEPIAVCTGSPGCPGPGLT